MPNTIIKITLVNLILLPIFLHSHFRDILCSQLKCCGSDLRYAGNFMMMLIMMKASTMLPAICNLVINSAMKFTHVS